MKKIVLLGYMGSGKTVTAESLAKELNLPCIDLDQYIEMRLEQSITSIFETKGEIFFRKKEHKYFKELMSSNESFILSLGGGTPCYANNHLLLNQDNTTSIYLKASIDTLVQRLQSEVSKRPILAQNKQEPLDTFIAKQLFDRSYYYYQATKVITVDNKTPSQITLEILNTLA